MSTWQGQPLLSEDESRAFTVMNGRTRSLATLKPPQEVALTLSPEVAEFFATAGGAKKRLEDLIYEVYEAKRALWEADRGEAEGAGDV